MVTSRRMSLAGVKPSVGRCEKKGVARNAYRISIHVVGKPTKTGWEAAAVEEYTKRLSGGDPAMQVETLFHKTNEQLLKAADKTNHALLVLDERGALLTSEEFETLLFDRLEEGGSRLSFIIGAAHGLPPQLRKVPKANPHFRQRPPGCSTPELVSLGRLTLPHRIARVVLVEQIYRGRELRRGSNYHVGDP